MSDRPREQAGKAAHAFIQTLERLPEQQRIMKSSLRYAQELNRLIEFARTAAPDVQAEAWPTKVPEQGASFVEIETAARQLFLLL